MKIEAGQTETLLKGMKVWRNQRNKYLVIETMVFADPRKDKNRLVCTNAECCDWTEDLDREGQPCTACGEGQYKNFGKPFHETVIDPLPIDRQRQEFYCDGTVRSGKRVFHQFSPDWHSGKVEPPPRVYLYRGWDFGGHHPACTVCYDDSALDRFCVLYAFVGFNITFRIFCAEVVKWSRLFWTKATFLEGVDPHGDWSNPHGGIIDEKGNETPVKHMRDVYHMNVDWDYTRPRELRDILCDLLVQRPSDPEGVFPFIVNRTESRILYSRPPQTSISGGTKVIIDGMNGQYHYKRRADGTYSEDPVKNLNSHPIDAMLYALARARRRKEVADNETYVAQLLGKRRAAMKNMEPDKYNSPIF